MAISRVAPTCFAIMILCIWVGCDQQTSWKSTASSLGISSSQKIKLLNNPGRISNIGDYVFIEGRWHAETPEDANSTHLPEFNSVSLYCSRTNQMCYESLAILTSPDGSIPDPTQEMMLVATSFNYRILEWTDHNITAITEPRAADIRLNISLTDKTATRIVTETSARGAKGADPRPHIWQIRDFMMELKSKR